MSEIKYLDLTGLTTYDRMLKEWFKSGIVDITDEAIKALFFDIQPNNEIWYISIDGNTINRPWIENNTDNDIVSHT